MPGFERLCFANVHFLQFNTSGWGKNNVLQEVPNYPPPSYAESVPLPFPPTVPQGTLWTHVSENAGEFAQYFHFVLLSVKISNFLI